MESKIRVSGNIISELSEKIPSNIIALNELIKNSYDAGANKVSIFLETEKKLLTITDDGSGMDKYDIDTLFHIAKSTKEYGTINPFTNRRTQGPKGLGFLSVFKFGSHVVWETYKQSGLKFEVDYNDLISSSDITESEIQITDDTSINKGTKITIFLDEYNVKSLSEYFNDEKAYKKILAAFDDQSIEISFIIDGKELSSKDIIPLTGNCIDRQLFVVKYDSVDKKIRYFYNNYECRYIDYDFTSTQYNVDIELVIFYFHSRDKSKIDSLFFNPKDDLTPLIYINANLFNNYELFDPGIMKNIKTQYVLQQMIGFIRINTEDKNLNFNSDRTKFLQNELSDEIIKFLKDINIKIQTEGSKMKKSLMNLDDFLTSNPLPSEASNASPEEIKSYIKTDFFFKDQFIINTNGNHVTFSLFGTEKQVGIKKPLNNSQKSEGNNKNNQNHRDIRENTSQSSNSSNTKDSIKIKIAPAKIKLKKKQISEILPSQQKKAEDYFSYAIDSNGKKIPFENIDVFLDDLQLDNKILPGVENPTRKTLTFKFQDKVTGLIIAAIDIYYTYPDSGFNGITDGLLLSSITRNGYSIMDPLISRLVSEINSLEIDKYQEVISCSLRTLFDLCIDLINKYNKRHIFDKSNTLEEQVRSVVEYVNSNKNVCTEIDKGTGIGFKNLNNLVSKPDDYYEAVKKAHLGAHKSTKYISEQDIRFIASKASQFIAIAHENDCPCSKGYTRRTAIRR